MRRGPVLVIVLICLGVGLTQLARVLRPQPVRTVVVITLDTLRYDRLGSSGRSPSITPALDALAERSAVFEHTWTTAPLTVPSHASLFTGLLPPQHGLRTNEPIGRLPTEAITVAEAFRDAGFETAAFVSASVLSGERTGLDAGFDLYDDVPQPAAGELHARERVGEETVALALDWLRARGDGEAFVWVHLFDPHAPYDAPPPFGAGPEHAADETGYDAEVRYTDDCVGRLLDGLAALGRENALIVVTADHGESLGEHGERTHGFLLGEATLHVPLLISAPEQVAPGRRDESASLIDVAPTVVGLAGLPVPRGMGGVPLLARKAKKDRPAYAESLYGWRTYGWAQAFAWRRGTRKWMTRGSVVTFTDLAADAGETAATTPDAANAEELDLLRQAAELELVAGLGATDGLEGLRGPYWGSSLAGPMATLAAEENAALPDPYARITDHEDMNRGRALLAAGRPAEALQLFRAVSARSPQNPAAARWTGRAELAVSDPDAAAASFRRAFDLGWRTPDAVHQALRASLSAATSMSLGSHPELPRALAFLQKARGQGVPDTAFTHIFEASIHLFLKDASAARSALDAARRAAPNERAQAAIADVERSLPPR